MGDIHFYETNPLNREDAIKFGDKFHNTIGTEAETISLGQDLFSVFCCELTKSEVNTCRQIELVLTGKEV